MIKKSQWSNLLSLAIAALCFLFIIAVVLFLLDAFHINTSGASYIITLGNWSFVSFFQYALYNGLFTLFAIITLVLFCIESVHICYSMH